MLAFLSFSYRNLREQQLLSSPIIVRHLAECAVRNIERSGAAAIAGVLCSSLNEAFPQEYPNIKYTFEEQTLSEIHAVQKFASESGMAVDGRWAVIVRPGQGYVSADRLAAFCRSLRETPREPGARDARYVLSVRRHGKLTHPCWGVYSCPGRFLGGGALRTSYEDATVRDALKFSDPRLWDALSMEACHRSQDISRVYHYDEALCAFPLSFDQDGGVEKLHVTSVPWDAEETGGSILYRTPVFDMSNDGHIDIRTLERLAE